MIRTDVLIATLEARILALRPDWASFCDALAPTAPIVVMATSRKWSLL